MTYVDMNTVAVPNSEEAGHSHKMDVLEVIKKNYVVAIVIIIP